jgi:hypothetical protein
MRRLAALILPLLLAACAAPAPVKPDGPPPGRVAELDPIAHWVGGRWVGTFESGGRKFTLVRTYEWAFDGRVIVGRSFAERDGTLVQQRETPFYWNPETRRIEFVDFLDNGGFGTGWLERRDGELYMDVRIVGNPKHPSWRGWVRESPDAQVIRIEALQGGKWVDFGTYPYRRQR